MPWFCWDSESWTTSQLWPNEHDHDVFRVSLTWWIALELFQGSATELTVKVCYIKSTFCSRLLVNEETICPCVDPDGAFSQSNFFLLILSHVLRYPVKELFNLANSFPMLDCLWMFFVVFFDKLTWRCKRISFNDCHPIIIVNFWGLAIMILIFKALVSFAKLLESPMYCEFINNFWLKCVIDF